MKKKTASRGLARRLAEAPATEKPVTMPPPELTSQYVVTVSNVTGLPTKIEKFDEAADKRAELSEEEYQQVLGFASPAAYSDWALSQAQLYYQGLTGYLSMLSSGA